MCKSKTSHDLPIIVSLIIIALGVIIFFRSEEPVSMADGSQYWASIVSACALIWLVFGFLQQNRSVEAQNISIDIQNKAIAMQEKHVSLYEKELRNQREELQLQRLELKRMSYSSTLMHIKEMVDKAMNEFDIRKYKEKSSYLNEDIKPMLESTDPFFVQESVRHWHYEYGEYIKYIKRIRDAAEFYFRMNGIIYNNDFDSIDTFLYVNSPHLANVPYLSEAYNIVAVHVHMNTMIHNIPALSQIALLASEYLINPKMIKIEALDKRAAQYEEKILPAIFFEYRKAKEKVDRQA